MAWIFTAALHIEQHLMMVPVIPIQHVPGILIKCEKVLGILIGGVLGSQQRDMHNYDLVYCPLWHDQVAHKNGHKIKSH